MSKFLTIHFKVACLIVMLACSFLIMTGVIYCSMVVKPGENLNITNRNSKTLCGSLPNNIAVFRYPGHVSL